MGWGGAAAGWGGCTKHVAKEDRAIASERAVPKVHSSTSPAHPCALRAAQRVAAAPSSPARSSSRGLRRGAVSPVLGRCGGYKRRSRAERRAPMELGRGAAKYPRASRGYAATIRRQQGASWGPAGARESIYRLLPKMNRWQATLAALFTEQADRARAASFTRSSEAWHVMCK